MFTEYNSSFQKTSLKTLHNSFMDIWTLQYTGVQAIDITEYLDKIDALDFISKNRNTFHLLLDSITLKVLFCTENFKDATGYTSEDLKRKNHPLFFESIEKSQLPFLFNNIEWIKYIQKNVKPSFFIEQGQYQWVGLTFKDKSGKKKRTLVNFNPIEVDENGQHRLFVVTFENITHLLKDDFGYFGRAELGKSKKIFSSFFDDSKFAMKDVLTEREYEIMKLIADGLDTKEIAAKLFISNFTVERHRKNMIERLGARDSFAMVEICKMCNMI
jgi:DNA-binding CsgD family transcriptional regulator/PAS domain-containing protein